MKKAYQKSSDEVDESVGEGLASLHAIIERSSNFKDYLSLLGKSKADQAFWMPLLPAYSNETSIAIVIDDTDGNISSKIAPYFRWVLCVHSDRDALVKIMAVMQKEQLDNVVPIQLDLSAPLPFIDNSIGLIVVLQASASHAFDKEHDVWGRYRSLLSNSKPVLNQNGTLVIVDNNAQNYRNFLRKSAALQAGSHGVSYRCLNQFLQKLDYKVIDNYIGDFYYTASFMPLPVFVKNGAVGDLSVYSMSAFYKIKQHIKHYFLPPSIWPSFMFVVSNKSHLRIVDEILAVNQISERLKWGAEEVIVKKIVAGNSGVTILILGPEGKKDRDVVVRYPRTKEGKITVQRNADALVSLSKEAFSDFVPKLYAVGTMGDADYIIEEKKMGLELDAFGREADLMVNNACERFIDMQMEGVVNHEVDDRFFSAFIDSTISPLEQLCDDDEVILLNSVKRFMNDVFVNENIPFVRSHGDYKMGNILFLDNGQIGGIIDWDMSEKNGLPLLDLYTLILYRLSSETGRSLADVYKNFLLPNKINDFYNDLIKMACAKYGLSAGLVFPLRCLFWLTHLRDRVSLGLKAHPDFSRENVGEVLVIMAEMIAEYNDSDHNKNLR